MHMDRRARAIADLQPYIERARRFTGWDFSEMRQTPLGPSPPWDYEALAREHAASASAVADLGTGGGEVFSRIIAGIRARLVATEEWHVNAPIARDRLRPFRVDVVRARVDKSEIPFADASFDLVLSRHEGILPSDIDRVLRPGGLFLTQQVAEGDLEELREFFPRMTVWPEHFHAYQDAFRSYGYEVSGQEHHRKVAYETLGDVVFLLMVAPWEISDFDPVAEVDALLALEDAHGVAQGIVLTEARYLTTARKPA